MPGLVTFDSEEIRRSVRADVALLLHQPQSVIDAMPDDDVIDIFAKHNANVTIQNELEKRRRR